MTTKINEKLDLKNEDIKDLTTFQPSCIFVIYNDSKDALNLYKKLNNAYQRSWLDILLCRKKEINPELLLKGHKVLTKIPDNPCNIYWEFVETTQTSRNIRFLICVILVILILILSFACNIIISVVGVSASLNLNCENKIYTFADLGPGKQMQVNCYCSQLSTSELLDQSDLCQFYYMYQVTEVSKSIGIAITIVIINFILYFVISRILYYIGYYSKSQLIVKKVLFTFILQYVNTAFVAYIIYGKFNGWSIISALETNFGTTINVQSQFSDVDRVWYPLVGSKLIFSILITVFNPTFLDLILFWISSRISEFRATFAKNRTQFLRILKPSRFRLEKNYVKIIAPFFIILTFSSAIPLLYFLFFLNLLFSYWVDKLSVIKFAKKPPLYSRKLILDVTQYIPAALIIHVRF